ASKLLTYRSRKWPYDRQTRQLRSSNRTSSRPSDHRLEALNFEGVRVKILWCWRCKTDVPMLDDAEFASIVDLYRAGFKAMKEFRQRWGIPLEGATVEQRLQPVSLR